MKARFDIRSLMLGGVSVGIVILLAGAVGSDPMPEIGRYQLACTQGNCYMVDSTTGQVWSNHHGSFWGPKIKSKAVRAKEAAKGYVGQWSGKTPDQSEVSIHLNADGLVHAKDEDGEVHEGRWWVVGDRITLSIDGETLTGQMSNGELILWEDGDEEDRVIFQRVTTRSAVD